jgi:hypothetical protein
MDVKTTLAQFDAFLENRGLDFDAVIIGGAALALLGIISRQTRDCDVMEPLIPIEIQDAVKEFAISVRQSGEFLQDNWLNHEPSSLSKLLPQGWQNNLQLIFKGKSLTLHTLGRQDLIRTKLFALCDRGTDLLDCIALKPSIEEIEEAIHWVLEQDTNPDWPRHVSSVLGDLGARLGYGI